MNPIKNVLHPTDFSENSHHALRVAAALARDQHGCLVILHVVPKAAPVIGDGKVAELERAERYQRDLKTYQEEMMARLRSLRVPDGHVRVEYLFEEGDVARVILRAAEQKACDLIVMGTHGKTGHQRIVLGSVAAEVSRNAQCPVVTVKLPAPQDQPVQAVVEVAGSIL